jgi:thiol-disulfide isomerase/thioredoxin
MDESNTLPDCPRRSPPDCPVLMPGMTNNCLAIRCAAFLCVSGRRLLLPLMLSLGTATAASLETHAPKPLPALHSAQLRTLLAQNRNSPLILTFWASWCEPCRDEMPALQRLAERWHDRGLRLITIAVADRPEAANDFLAKNAAGLPLVLDPEQNIARDWGIYMLPASLVLDRRHRIVGRAHGAIDWDAVAVDQQLQSLFQRK